MARELQISYNGAAATLYVVIRATADGTVWNASNSALETFSDVTLATNAYNVNLTDRGGDLYDGDVPTGLPAGDYRFFYYERASSTAATTDLVLKAPLQHWDGAALGSSSSVSLSSFALTTLDSAKRRLGITDSDSDTVLTEYINMVSATIERITGVNFKARDYREWYDGDWQTELVLNHYPVQKPVRIAWGAAQAMTVQFTTGTNIRANAAIYRDPESADAGGLRLSSVSSTGTETTTDLSFATYKSVSALVTAVAAVSGWSATTVKNTPTSDLHPSGGEDALGRPVYLYYPDRSQYAMSVSKSGRVRFDNWAAGWPWYQATSEIPFPRGFQHVLAQFRAGYETIPADVQLLANEIIADKYFEGQTGRGATEVRLGPYITKLDASQIDDIREQLKNYLDESQLIGGVD